MRQVPAPWLRLFMASTVVLTLAVTSGLVPAEGASGRVARTAQSPSCGADLLGVAQGFNIFVHANYGATGTDVKGRAAAGGNVSINSYAVGVDLPASAGRADLIAGGNLSVGSGGAQAPNGSVTYDGTLQGSITTPNGQLTKAPPPFQFDDEFAALQARSLSLAALPANGTAGGPAYAFDLTGTNTGTNVFTISAADLQAAQVIRIKVPTGSSTLVNVAGDAYTSASYPTAAIQFWNGSGYVQLPDNPSPSLEALRTSLLWNFPTATSVQIGPNMAWEGTVLAPRAAVVFPGSTPLNGTLIAASLESSAGSARNHPYTGCVPVAPPAPTVQAVDDQYSVAQGSVLRVTAPGVLVNDVYPVGSTPAAAVVAKPGHGSLSLATDGSFTYTPANGFAGTDTFTYKLTAGGVTSGTATVTITVEKGPPKLLTVVARTCPTYKDVTANLARNNIQESLKDLGADTAYQSGQPINPDIEKTNQPNCTPIVGWQFTLGTGYLSRAVSGPWGSLSIVTDPYSTSLVTQESVPLLNDQGVPTGRDLSGAVTVALTDDQAAQAANPSSLWIQGGTPEDPILNALHPGEYGFAALRCAVDNLNGDNVEWIGYPAGATHMFCYAYYVKPPPTSGTIVVRKVVSDPAGATQSFPFTGNISFNPDNSFSLDVSKGQPASITFYRAETQGDLPWTFAENVPPRWHLTSIHCDSKAGTSKTTTDLDSAKTTVRLAAGDTVTCTYTDSQTPPKGGLRLSKTTIGGIGTFTYSVTHESAVVATATVTTTDPGTEVVATPATISLDPGTYQVAESLPTTNAGTWTLTGVSCNGISKSARSPVSVTISSGSGVACSFENTFVPVGSITIHKVAYGNTGTAGFTISPVGPTAPPASYTKKAKVTQPGVPVLATGDETDALPLGQYKIQEFAPEGTDPSGWALTSVVCGGQAGAASQGAVVVTLTSSNPSLDCVFTNTWTASPSPPEPTRPAPPSPDPIPVAEIHVTKTADRSTVEVGDTVTYTIKVSNTGGAEATGVTVAEQTPIANVKILSVTPSQGTCQFAHAPASCSLGTIQPGKTVTIIGKLQPTKEGSLPNRVAVSSATQVLRPPTADVNGDATEKGSNKPGPKPSAPTKPSAPPKPPAKPGKPGGNHHKPPFTG
jgi:choice-of-anchor A domain-containing protein/uncharacterized repeat protein (TIGR01451 family)